MTIHELISQLQQLVDKYGDNMPVYKSSVNVCTGKRMFTPIANAYCDNTCHPGKELVILSSSTTR